MKKHPIRVLLSKIGLDGHNWGILAVGLALKDAGFEVIYLGRHVMPEQIAEAAIQEDADIVGLSSLADAHRVLAPRVVSLLREKGSDIPVILGGFIQPEDVPELKANGIEEVFPINTRLDHAVTWVTERVKSKRKKSTP